MEHLCCVLQRPAGLKRKIARLRVKADAYFNVFTTCMIAVYVWCVS